MRLGELKHGTLALIEEGIPVIALATQEAVLEKTVSNIKEVSARGADIMAITHEEHVASLLKSVNQAFAIPKTLPLLTPSPVGRTAAAAVLLRFPRERKRRG